MSPEFFMIEIRVHDWSGMLAWYRDMLGLPALLIDPDRSFALLGGDRGRVALRRDDRATGGGGRVGLVFEVSDLDEARARLIALGVSVGEPREDGEERYREVRLSDPEGWAVRLFCWT